MNEKELYAVTCMALSDWPKEKVDAIFFHGRGEDDFDGLFELAEKIWRESYARIVINGFDGSQEAKNRGGYLAPDSKFYLVRLIELGVFSGDIVITKPCFNTNEENDAFVKLAKEKGWKSAVMIGQPHQVSREFLGAIQSMKKFNYAMRMYSAYPKSVFWFKEVFANISIDKKKQRFDFISEEFERIFRYQEKGDLCTFEEFFEYMRNRDKIP